MGQMWVADERHWQEVVMSCALRWGMMAFSRQRLEMDNHISEGYSQGQWQTGKTGLLCSQKLFVEHTHLMPFLGRRERR